MDCGKILIKSCDILNNNPSVRGEIFSMELLIKDLPRAPNYYPFVSFHLVAVLVMVSYAATKYHDQKVNWEGKTFFG